MMMHATLRSRWLLTYLAVLLTLGQAAPLIGTLAAEAPICGSFPEGFDAQVGIVTPSYLHDSDDDGIDDRLEEAAIAHPLGSADVIAVLSHPLDSAGRRDLRDLGTVPTELHSLNLVTFHDLPLVRLGSLARIEGVAQVQYAPPVRPTLDVSRENIRIATSFLFDHTVLNDYDYEGTGVTIAVLDTGIDNAIHASLDDLDDDSGTSDPKVAGGADSSGAGINPAIDPADDDGHGTAVAAVAAGTGGNGKFSTYRGMAPRSRLVDVRVLDGGDTIDTAADLIEGINWVKGNAAIFNITVAIIAVTTDEDDDGTGAVSQSVNTLVSQTAIIPVVAIGNDGPAARMGQPASADLAITVGAYDDAGTPQRSDDHSWALSSRGPRISDGDATTTDELKPDVVAPGVLITTAEAGSSDNVTTLSGTSLAAPHVAGIVALLKEVHPAITPAQVKNLLRHTATMEGPASAPATDPKWNNATGAGRVDGYGAVRRALDVQGLVISGPQTAAAGEQLTYDVELPFFRTDSTRTDSLTLSLTLPLGWGHPSATLTDSVGGGSMPTITVTELVGATLISGTINYTSAPPAERLQQPLLSVTTFAPSSGGAPVLTASGDLSDLPLTPAAQQVTIDGSTSLTYDLRISAGDVLASDSTPAAGEVVNVSVTVHNDGTGGVIANLSLTDGPPPNGLPIGAFVVSVPPGGADDVTLPWLATAGTHELWATADPTNGVPETDETNNANFTIAAVVGGVNKGPTAVLRVSPTSAGTGQPLHFEGNDSSDEDGVVVRYNFHFDDGTVSGWVTTNTVDHAYEGAGGFDPYLEVQDNGGQSSNGSTPVHVTIAPTQEATKTLFLREENSLHFAHGSAEAPLTIALPDTWVPLFPGSTQGQQEWQSLAAFTTDPLRKNATLDGDALLHLWVHNSGSATLQGLQLGGSLLKDTTELASGRTTATDVAPDESIEVTVSAPLAFTNITVGDRLRLELEVSVHGGGGELLYGSKGARSGIDLPFNSFVGTPPSVDGGDDRVASVGKSVLLEFDAQDADGEIVEVRADLTGDGSEDVVTTALDPLTHTYESEGTFTVRLVVVDDDDQEGSDTFLVSVTTNNAAPVLTRTSPTAVELSVAVGRSQVFTAGASDPDGDPFNLSWRLDTTDLHVSTNSYNFTATEQQKGEHTLRVQATDGLATTELTWKVTVSDLNLPPRINGTYPNAGPVTVSVGTEAQFGIEAIDPEGTNLTYHWSYDTRTVGADQYFFLFTPSDLDIGTHAVSVSVTDGVNAVEVQWQLSVVAVDLPPTDVRISVLPDKADYTPEELISFEGSGTDPEGQLLTFAWSSNISGSLGGGKTLSVQLEEGTHRITLTVSDGSHPVTASVEIVILAPTTGEPPVSAWVQYGPVAALLVLLLIVVAAALYHGRGGPSEDLPRSRYDRDDDWDDDLDQEEDEAPASPPRRRPPAQLRGSTYADEQYDEDEEEEREYGPPPRRSSTRRPSPERVVVREDDPFDPEVDEEITDRLHELDSELGLPPAVAQTRPRRSRQVSRPRPRPPRVVDSDEEDEDILEAEPIAEVHPEDVDQDVLEGADDDVGAAVEGYQGDTLGLEEGPDVDEGDHDSDSDAPAARLPPRGGSLRPQQPRRVVRRKVVRRGPIQPVRRR